ncbi:MAG: hypothetical protein ACKOX6_13310 [Bdellovibrio sp.]
MSATEGKNVMVQGRIVWVAGDLFKGKPKTDQNTRQPIIDQKTGLQKIEFGFGLAVPKSVLNQMGAGEPGEIWRVIHEEAQAMYQGRQVPPAFAWKYKDGDSVDQNGVPFAQREGYAGCLVFACTTSIPIKFFKFDQQLNQNIQVNEGIKCGDYVNVQLSVKAHPAIGQGKPGLYLNPNAVQLIGYGKEIVNAPSGDQVFGTQAPPLPPGASATPVAPMGGFLTSPNGQAPQSFGPPPVQAPAAPAAPNYGVLPPIHQPQNQQVPQAPVAPQQFGMGMPGPAGFPPPAVAPQAPQPMGYQQPVAPQFHGTQPTPAGNGMPSFPMPGHQYR